MDKWIATMLVIGVAGASFVTPNTFGKAVALVFFGIFLCVMITDKD